MDAKLSFFSELYNILSVKVVANHLKGFLTDWRMAFTIIACYIELL